MDMFRWPICLCAVLLMLCPGCASAPSPGVFVTLETGLTAPLGGTMTLRATVTSTRDQANADISFRLPKGVVVTSGTVQQKIQLQKNVPQTFEVQVLLVELGEQLVSVVANVYPTSTSQGGDANRLYLEVGEASTEVRDESIIPTPTTEGLNQRQRLEQLVTPTP